MNQERASLKAPAGWTSLGVLLLAVAHYQGLFVAPAEATMGDVYRILYVHVPTAWLVLVVYLWAFLAAIPSLWTGRRIWDARLEACVEVGLLLNCLVLIQGSIWARPTWGVWWTWDPRLTTTAVMLVSFVGVMVLRSMIQPPSRRAVVTAIATIIAFVDVPVVYMSVKWWNSLHQMQSSPETVDQTMILPLRMAAFGMLFLSMGFVGFRRRIAEARLALEDDAPDLPRAPVPLALDSVGGEE
jgi:heme exporter protein C